MRSMIVLFAVMGLMIPFVSSSQNKIPDDGIPGCVYAPGLDALFQSIRTNEIAIAIALKEENICFKLDGGLEYTWIDDNISSVENYKDLTIGKINVKVGKAKHDIYVITEMLRPGI